jgi:hypothetical protein
VRPEPRERPGPLELKAGKEGREQPLPQELRVSPEPRAQLERKAGKVGLGRQE